MGLDDPNSYAVPAALVEQEGETCVEWRTADGERFSAPFFSEALSRFRYAGLPTFRTPLSALERHAAAPDALIFHVSRCGSTLATRMLGAAADHLTVSEPPVIDQILRETPAATDEQRVAWLRGVMAALARSQAEPARRMFVKLDAWHLFELPLLRRAFPGVPMLFLYRDPLEVLVSIAKIPSLMSLRGTVPTALLGLTAAEYDALPHRGVPAVVQGALYRTALAHRDLLIAIAYPDLIETLPRLEAFAFTPEEQATMRAATSVHAKSPEEAFAPDAARKQTEAPPDVRAAAERWARPDYDRWLAAL